MKIAVFSPYIPKHFGGGDAYIWRVAARLAEHHQVKMAISGLEPLSSLEVAAIRKKYEDFLGFSLAKIEIQSCPLFTHESWWKKIQWTAQFDVLYYLTDGSLLLSLARQNILHIQIPFTQPQTGLLNRLKLKQWRVKNTNSEFTRQVVAKAWQTNIPFVHYPAVVEVSPNKHTKEQTIIHVGRFFRQLHSKRQDVLIEMFANLRQLDPKNSRRWKLQLVGGIEDQEFVAELQKKAAGLPVEFHHDLSHTQLKEMLDKASIYWHATGVGIDPQLHPEQQEHFGISTVEAMAAGCIPIVINQGGQPEVVGSELQGLLWESPEEGVLKTSQLLSHPEKMVALQAQARERAAYFSKERLDSTLEEMLHA